MHDTHTHTGAHTHPHPYHIFKVDVEASMPEQDGAKGAAAGVKPSAGSDFLGMYTDYPVHDCDLDLALDDFLGKHGLAYLYPMMVTEEIDMSTFSMLETEDDLHDVKVPAR